MKFSRIFLFDSIDSTNNFLKNHLELPHLTLVQTRFQTQGRGQFDRRWESKPNDNFLFSLLWKKHIDVITMKKIEKAFIRAGLTYLQSMGIAARHKMPNDLLVSDKKIAGLLIESMVMNASVKVLIIGMGLNVNQTVFSPGLNATSMKLETQKTYSLDVEFKRFTTIIKSFLSTI